MSYPLIKNDDFYEKINQKYHKYTISKKKPTFDEICFPKEFKLQIPQHFLADYINPKTPYKGVLIFHRIGAGKTCTAVSICEQWKEYRKIMVLVPASLISNFRDELRSPCAGSAYLTVSERKELERFHPSTEEYKRIIKKSDARINKVYTIMSYNKFIDLSQQKKINLHNTLLVVDEIQNMVSEQGTYYNVLYDEIHSAPSSLRVVLLSATPMFDKPVEIALTLNLLRLPLEFPSGREFENLFIKSTKIGNRYIYSAKNMEMFKEMIKGFVSYYRGAPPYVFPHSTIKYVHCKMSGFQYRSYLTVLKKENIGQHRQIARHSVFQEGEIMNLPNNFYIGTRIISNIAFPNKGINEDGYDSFQGAKLSLKQLRRYSCKFYRMIRKIMKSPGPVFVYSGFKEFGGLKSFTKVLDALGYKDYTQHGEGRKRYAVWSGDSSMDQRQEITAVYNQPDNFNGSKLRIICGSPSMKEGVSLKRCRQVHIMEPYWNQSRLDQIIGRAIRYCSHKDLDEEDRIVDVFIYVATHPEETQTIDQMIVMLANQKNRLIKQFETSLKEAAVDCTLFKHGNVYSKEEDYTCMK